jgi:uncharacterized protein YqhQ
VAEEAGAGNKPLRLGGMALGNGLLVHGPTSWAAAVRRRDGSIAVASGRKPRAPRRVGALPGLRGVARIAESIAVVPIVRRALPEARLPFESARVLAAAAGTAVAAGALRRRGREASAVAVSLVPSLVMLASGDTAAYHGAEHKTIGAYETDDAAGEHAKEHDRCGSHLMAPMLAANVAGAALLRRLLVRPGRVAQGAVSIASIGAAVEVFAWAERHADSAAARLLRAPGHELQRRLGTREPSADQLEVGRVALEAFLAAEGASAGSRA